MSFLQEHMAKGRLDATEFDERMTAALRARTGSEIAVLFADLPEPRPAPATPMTFQAPPWQRQPVAPPSQALTPRPAAAPPEQPSMNKGLAIAAAAAWPLTLLVLFATSWQYWWLIFIPIFISSVVGGKQQWGHRK